MTLDEANEKTRQFIAGFYGDDHVYYAEAKLAKKVEPYITVKFTYPHRQFHAINEFDPDSEWLHSYREITGHVDLNLYTKGRNVSGGVGVPVYYNSALNDLQEFLNYLDSEQGQYEMMRNNMSILPTDDPKDLSALQNNSSYQYRAMVELEVHYMDDMIGEYGQNNTVELPDNSNGGSTDFIQTEPYLIKKVQINGDEKGEPSEEGEKE